MAEMVHFPAHLAAPAWFRDRLLEPAWNRLQPLVEVVRSGAKVFRMNPLLFSLWFLLPLLLVLTSDWIGVLVAFQAMTAALRLRNGPAAKALATCSSASVPANTVKGECRAL